MFVVIIVIVFIVGKVRVIFAFNMVDCAAHFPENLDYVRVGGVVQDVLALNNLFDVVVAVLEFVLLGVFDFGAFAEAAAAQLLEHKLDQLQTGGSDYSDCEDQGDH